MADSVDEVLAGVGAALEAVGRGERVSARSQLEALWDRVGIAGDPLHRCAIAHTLADVQDDPNDELVWDERALEAALSVDAERMQQAGMLGSPGSLLPSLHLNLADVLTRLGRREDAAAHVKLGEAELDSLPADGYRDMITAAFQRITNATTGK